MARKIAIVDDEPDICNLVSLHLSKASFQVEQFEDSESLLSFLRNDIPDLIILDLMLPDADGFEICKQLKGDAKYSEIPIIMLTAKGEETDKVLGLELGADDYVTKPFSPKELVARVKAVLRRNTRKEGSRKITAADSIEIDLQKYEVFINGKKIDLTSTEFRILQLLAGREGWVYSRERILEHLWGNEKIVLDRTIDVHITNLRKKLGKAGKLIKNIRGIGYKLET